MFDRKQYQQDFLWYSYFGIVNSDIQNGSADPEGVCIRRAYLDLNRTLDYSKSESVLKKETKDVQKAYSESKRIFRNEIEKKLKELITGLLSETEASEAAFDAWHRRACEEVLTIANNSKYNHEPLFAKRMTYGQAQKWINMTLKYMLVMGLRQKEMEKIVLYMHIPLDSYIFSAASVKEGGVIYDGDAAKGLGIKKPDIVWSQLSPEQYIAYQSAARAKVSLLNMSSIEWEGAAWIAQAKKENNR